MPKENPLRSCSIALAFSNPTYPLLITMSDNLMKECRSAHPRKSSKVLNCPSGSKWEVFTLSVIFVCSGGGLASYRFKLLGASIGVDLLNALRSHTLLTTTLHWSGYWKHYMMLRLKSSSPHLDTVHAKISRFLEVVLLQQPKTSTLTLMKICFFPWNSSWCLTCNGRANVYLSKMMA